MVCRGTNKCESWKSPIKFTMEESFRKGLLGIISTSLGILVKEKMKLKGEPCIYVVFILFKNKEGYYSIPGHCMSKTIDKKSEVIRVSDFLTDRI